MAENNVDKEDIGAAGDVGSTPTEVATGGGDVDETSPRGLHKGEGCSADLPESSPSAEEVIRWLSKGNKLGGGISTNQLLSDYNEQCLAMQMEVLRDRGCPPSIIMKIKDLYHRLPPPKMDNLSDLAPIPVLPISLFGIRGLIEMLWGGGDNVFDLTEMKILDDVAPPSSTKPYFIYGVQNTMLFCNESMWGGDRKIRLTRRLPLTFAESVAMMMHNGSTLSVALHTSVLCTGSWQRGSRRQGIMFLPDQKIIRRVDWGIFSSRKKVYGVITIPHCAHRFFN